MRKTLLNLAAAAAVVAGTAGAQAGTLVNAPTGTAVIYTFAAVDWDPSGSWADVAVSFGDSSTWVVGSLTSVRADVSLTGSSGSVPALANDLAVVVQDATFSYLIQVGGGWDSGVDASQRYAWTGGASSVIGTSLAEKVDLIPIPPSSTYLHFAGDGTDGYSILVGNGQADPGVASWAGSVTLYGLQLVAAPVPEPASWAMFAAGAVGLVGWLGRRRKAAVTA